MILKIAGNNGWHFKEKIKDVFVKPFIIEKYNAQKERSLEWKDIFLSRHEIHGETNGGSWTVIANDQPSDCGVSSIMVQYQDGNYETYLADLAVYLMSDEGKTIERIN